MKNKLISSLIIITASLFVTQLHAYSSGGLAGFEVSTGSDANGLKRVKQKLVAPPFLPKHNQVAKDGPKVVEVELTVVEKEMEIAPGVKVQTLTFNGTNPGPMIIVHEGDYVELTLKNPKSNSMVHNIDLHASTGALGGAALTDVAPGETAILRFKADRTGVFVYHCAPGGVMIPYHVASGMNGAIMVLPRNGLRDSDDNLITYDNGYYIGEQDWYVPQDNNGNYKTYPNAGAAVGDVIDKMKTLKPSHITFNGKVGALTGAGALKAKVGETILFVHSQANRDTRVHLIGGHADNFWHGGSFDDKPMTNRQTWPIFGGEAAAMTYTFKQPGIYAYVNHNLIEAIMFGAAAHVVVEGEWNHDLMTQVKPPK